ncbi:unnamed protein product, partial [Allacma fusca]
RDVGTVAGLQFTRQDLYACITASKSVHPQIGCCEKWINPLQLNEIGTYTTPSCIAFDDDGDVTVGRVAKTSTAVDPLYTVYDIKRLIGRRFDDPLLQTDIKLWPFKVIGEDNVPKLVLRGKSYHPEQVSAKVLAHMKKIAEDYLRHAVTRAVITVPAYFNDG